MSLWILGIIIVLCGVVGLAIARSNAIRRRSELLNKRLPLDDSVWLTDVEEKERLMVLKAVDFFAGVLGIDRNRLYPTDRFDAELNLCGWFLIDEDVEEELRECVRDSFKNVVWMDQWATLGDAVFGVAQQLIGQETLNVSGVLDANVETKAPSKEGD